MAENNQSSRCEDCINFEYDDEYDEYHGEDDEEEGEYGVEEEDCEEDDE